MPQIIQSQILDEEDTEPQLRYVPCGSKIISVGYNGVDLVFCYSYDPNELGEHEGYLFKCVRENEQWDMTWYKYIGMAYVNHISHIFYKRLDERRAV